MISDEQKARRRSHIGSSDCAAILGLSPFASAEDIRLDKLGRVEEWKGNDATSAGTYLETAILNWAADTLGVELLRDKMVVHPNGVMAANLDGFSAADRFVVEVKTSGVVGPLADGWGAGETSEVPDTVYVQVQHQLACTGYETGYVAALLGGIGFRLYTIPRDVEFIAGMERTLCRFWQVNVLGDTPAPNSLASMDTLKRLKRQPSKIVDIRHADLSEYVELKRQEDELAAKVEAAKQRLMASLGDAEAGAVDGAIVVDYSANKRGVRSLKIKQHKGANRDNSTSNAA